MANVRTPLGCAIKPLSLSTNLITSVAYTGQFWTQVNPTVYKNSTLCNGDVNSGEDTQLSN